MLKNLGPIGNLLSTGDSVLLTVLPKGGDWRQTIAREVTSFVGASKKAIRVEIETDSLSRKILTDSSNIEEDIWSVVKDSDLVRIDISYKGMVGPKRSLSLIFIREA